MKKEKRKKKRMISAGLKRDNIDQSINENGVVCTIIGHFVRRIREHKLGSKKAKKEFW